MPEASSLVTVSPGWLLGAALAIITAVASGVLWLANRFGKVENRVGDVDTGLKVLTSEVSTTRTDVAEIKTTVSGHDSRIRDVEIGMAKLKGPTRRMKAAEMEE